MDISVLTIFPELFDSFLRTGIVRRAVDMGKLTCSICSIRNFALGSHRSTDDRPFGGGCGMVMKAGPIVSAIKASKEKMPLSKTLLLSPQGKKIDQTLVSQISSLEGLILVCGRYEGVDERILGQYVDFEISIGDYVLTGGELAAMVVIDSLVRLIPGVLGNPNSAGSDTFSDGLIEHAHYTRPRFFEGESVPKVLTSGNHNAIERWRFETSLIRTLLKRRDILENRKLSSIEIDILNKWRLDIENIIRKQLVYSTDSLSSS